MCGGSVDHDAAVGSDGHGAGGGDVHGGRFDAGELLGAERAVVLGGARRELVLADLGGDSGSYTTPPTTTAQSGTKYEATFTNAFGSTTTNAATLTVNAPAAPKIDAKVTATGATPATVSLSTPTAGDLVVAFVAGDGPSSGGQKATVSGGGLRWALVGRTNSELGTAEIWSARAAGRLNRAAIKASLAKTGYKVSLTVLAFSGRRESGRARAPARSPAPRRRR